eukprot:198052_1
MAFGSNRFHSVGVLFVFYMAYYWFKVVHRPRVYFHANALNQKVIQKCKSIGRNYWPLFLFHNQYCQLFIGIILGKLYPILFKPNYHREMFTLQDGQNIALDWIYPQTPNPQVIKHNIPICIALYGVAGDNKSFNIYRYCSLIASKLNFYCVVLGRRGHEVDIPLTVPKMTIFGGQEDLHSVLLHMNRKYPNNPLILIGDSAGTGFWVRYLGDLGLCLNQKYADMHNKSSSKLIPKQYQNALSVHQQILCSVLICPGYDTSEAVSNIQNWVARKLVLFLMKRTYIANHKRVMTQHNKDIVDKCSASNSCIELYRDFSGSSLAGYGSYNQFLLETNPVETVPYIESPLLTVNSRDDPISTNVCLDQWKWVFSDERYCKHAILVETEYGSHSIFMSMFGGFYLDNVIFEYLQTMYQMYLNDKDLL